MKKTLSTAALSTVLVLGMAASAFATHGTQPDQTSAVSAAGAAKITLDGSIRERGRMQKTDSVKDTPNSSFYDGRIRLGIKAHAEHVTGYVQFESQGDSTANNPQSDTYTWGGQQPGLFNGGQKHNTLEVLQAWIDYQPSNWGVKVGHMPLALGNNLFFDHTGYGDDAVMAYGTFSGTHVAGILIKAYDGKKDHTNDLDAYVALATHQFSDNLDGGINYTYATTGTDATWAGMTAATTPDAGFSASGAPIGFELSNVGINANYRQDKLSFLADGEFQFGHISDNGTATVDAEGWAVKLGANMDLGAAKVGLLYGYGSGDDKTGSANHSFVTFLSDTNYDTILAGYEAYVPGTNFGGLGQATHSGLSNLSEYQINASTKTTCPITGKPLAIMASATYLRLNEEGAAALDTDSAGNNYLGNDKTVGTELDAVATWTLAPGLIYKVEAAYMFTGDAWNTTASSDPDNLYFLRHRLEFTF
ncbi:alginate export family protein [Desulfobacterota bacterium M19]